MDDPEWPEVGVVVLNWNDYGETAECLERLRTVEYPNLRVVVVDNDSSDGSGERLAAEFDWCEFVFNDRNRGFGGGCNHGIDRALSEGAEYVFLLNNDAVVEDGCLREAVSVARESDASVVGALVESGDGSTVNPSPNYFPDMFFYSGYRANLPFRPDADDGGDERWWATDRVEGAGVLLSRDLLLERNDSVGYYLDESLFMYCEEIELAMWCRQRAKTSVVAERATVRHAGEASSNRAFQLYYLTRNRVLIARRFLRGPWRIGFELLYPATRLALAGRQLLEGRRAVAGAILAGLLDGYRGIDGKRRAP